MTGMDTQVENSPLPAPVEQCPPLPPPPPGCMGAVQLPCWRSEPLPPHLAPTKEAIEKEQYAKLPDKLLNTLNKDKKPFTYTPQGVSGIEKGKLDLTNIRSPKMKKRLMANLADEEEDSDSERVTRSETPDISSKPKPVTNTRRAITPDAVSLNKQTYVPVLPTSEPVFPEERQSPIIYRHVPQDEFESFLKRQMQEMEESFVKSEQQSISEVNKENVERDVPITVANTKQEVVIPKTNNNEPESTKPVEAFNRLEEEFVLQNNNHLREESQQNNSQMNGNNGMDLNRVSNSYDNGNRNKSDAWNSDLLKHVLDGGLQEEIEKFEQISLETEDSFKNRPRSSLNDNNFEKKGPKLFEETQYESYNRSPYSEHTWSPPNYIQNPYIQPQSPYGSLNRKQQSKSPQPFHQWSGQQYWTDSPSPSPQSLNQHSSPSADPLYRGGNIPSNSYTKQKSGITDAEVPNYNSRPKPFYLCSPPPTPTATPPPQFIPQYLPQQQSKQPKTPAFGSNILPKKINYQTDLYNSEIEPQTRYIENAEMFSQTTYTDEEWKNPKIESPAAFRNSGVKTPDRFNNSGVRSPETYLNAGVRTPEPIVNSGHNMKKKLPPSEQPPDPTPSKYMGANIPSRSFRVLQLMTGEDIANQFSACHQNDFKENININPKIGYNNSNTSRSSGYSCIQDFGTDF